VPLGNLINFVLIQTWSPGFKSTWDAIMTVLWSLLGQPFRHCFR
jgi:hypothetical protein